MEFIYSNIHHIILVMSIVALIVTAVLIFIVLSGNIDEGRLLEKDDLMPDTRSE